MRLPDGLVVRLLPSVRSHDAGRTLLRRDPVGVSHLADVAAARVVDGRVVVGDAVSRALAERLLDTGLATPELDVVEPVPLDDLTVVVPVRDRPEALNRLLTTLAGVRVVVVDDASRDAAAMAAVVQRHDQELLALPSNAGPAGARNAGLARSTTSVVAFVDSDVVIAPADLERLARHLVDDRVALVAPRVRGLAVGGGWIERYEAGCSSLDLGASSGVVRSHGAIGWLPAAVLVGRREVLGDGFDVALRSGEDVDLVWRLEAAGHLVRYDADVEARHEHRDALVPWLARKVVYGSSAAGLAARHGTRVAPAVVTPTTLAVAGGLLLGPRRGLVVAAVVGAANAVRVSRALARSGARHRIAAEVAARGVGSSLAQAAALALRHAWPVAVLAAVVSRRWRRTLVTIALADGVIGWSRGEVRLDPVRFTVARRLDDAAYGAGVWTGMARARSWAALRPEVRLRSRRRPGPPSR